MPFFKWKAYDLDIKYTSEAEYKYHEGVIECSRMEMVVLELAKQDLVASEIEITDYDTYRKWQIINTKIKKLRRNKPQPITDPIQPHRAWWGGATLPRHLGPAAVIIAVIIFLLILLLSHR